MTICVLSYCFSVGYTVRITIDKIRQGELFRSKKSLMIKSCIFGSTK